MRRGRKGLLRTFAVVALATLLTGLATVAIRSPHRPGSAVGGSTREVALGARASLALPSAPAPLPPLAVPAPPPPPPAEAPGSAPAPGDQAIQPAPATFDGPAESAPAPGALADRRFAGVQPSGGVWAVMIGINNYPGGRNDLQAAVPDARDVDEALSRFGVPGDHRLLLLDGQAAASTIATAADWLVAHAAPDATAVFFYAGHVRKLSSGTEAIVGADGRTLTDAALGDHLRPLQAHATWIGIAACYGGGFDELLGPGRVLTAAADADHVAYENEGFHRSYMVEYMVRKAMIEGAAPGTIQSAFAWAKAALDRDYPGRAPVEYDMSGGSVDVHQPAPPPPAGASPSGGSGSDGSGGSDGSTPPSDGCGVLTFGVVRCGSGASVAGRPV